MTKPKECCDSYVLEYQWMPNEINIINSELHIWETKHKLTQGTVNRMLSLASRFSGCDSILTPQSMMILNKLNPFFFIWFSDIAGTHYFLGKVFSSFFPSRIPVSLPRIASCFTFSHRPTCLPVCLKYLFFPHYCTFTLFTLYISSPASLWLFPLFPDLCIYLLQLIFFRLAFIHLLSLHSCHSLLYYHNFSCMCCCVSLMYSCQELVWVHTI